MDRYRSAWDKWAEQASRKKVWNALRAPPPKGYEYRYIGNKTIDNLTKPVTGEVFREPDIERYTRAVYPYGTSMRSEDAFYILRGLGMYHHPEKGWNPHLIRDVLKILLLQFCLNHSGSAFGHLADIDIQNKLSNITDIVHCNESLMLYIVSYCICSCKLVVSCSCIAGTSRSLRILQGGLYEVS